jgi:hypothetical protein
MIFLLRLNVHHNLHPKAKVKAKADENDKQKEGEGVHGVLPLPSIPISTRLLSSFKNTWNWMNGTDMPLVTGCVRANLQSFWFSRVLFHYECARLYNFISISIKCFAETTFVFFKICRLNCL